LAKNAEWTVAFAGNHKEAVEQFQQHTPDLVVADLEIPEMKGIEFVELIRELHPGIPVVLTAAFGGDEVVGEVSQTGAARYIPKDELDADLGNTMSQLLATARRQQIRNGLQSLESDFDFEFENDPLLLATLTHELRQNICERGLFNESECLRFVTAVEEALTNAYYHGNLELDSDLRELDGNDYYELASQRRCQVPYCNRRIHVHARINADQVCITIRDEGSGFDHSQVPDPTDPEFLDRPHGRGLLLMRSFVDELHFNDLGNEVTLVKWTA
jgi:CheY-like chemotaxis protein